jgi:hypothetical protein
MLRESTQRFPNVSVASFSNRYLIHYAGQAKGRPFSDVLRDIDRRLGRGPWSFSTRQRYYFGAISSRAGLSVGPRFLAAS